MKNKQVFDGRVIFDHLPKTGGQAVNSWLRDALGDAVVTENLIGRHAELISTFGGMHSIISAHILFERKGFDPRYQYFTCIREPIDRAISWLYFITKNINQDDIPELWLAADRFIKSDGDELSVVLYESLSNIYVEHFSRINEQSDLGDDQILANALKNIEKYDVWGLYESLPEFLSDVARLIAMPAPKLIGRINVTVERPQVSQISEKLRLKLLDLNALDIRLYAELRRRYNVGPAFRQTLAGRKKIKRLMPMDKPIKREYLGYGTQLVTFSGSFSGDVKCGEFIRLSVDLSFLEPVNNLEYGIHISDSLGRVIFGSNNLLHSQSAVAYTKGIHRLLFCFVADLPDGVYSIGISVVDKQEYRPRELAFYDCLLGMKVVTERKSNSSCYRTIPIDFSSIMLSASPVQEIDVFRCEIILLSELNACITSSNYSLEVELVNRSDQVWFNSYSRPINVAHHWYNTDGSIQASESRMMPLTFLQIKPGKSIQFMIDVEAPNVFGRHQLEIFFVYGGFQGVDGPGFLSKTIDVLVHEPGQKIILSGNHCSLKTQAGLRIGDAICSRGKNGVLLFGPYMPLPAGKYYVQFYGKVLICDGAHVDVVSDKGQFILGKSRVRKAKSGKAFAEVEVVLSEAVNDLETRIWVTEVDNIKFESVAIVPFNN